MKKSIKTVITHISPKKLRGFLETHIANIVENKKKKEITILIDKKYALNDIKKTSKITQLLESIKKAYGSEYSGFIKLDTDTIHHDREMKIPRAVHY